MGAAKRRARTRKAAAVPHHIAQRWITLAMQTSFPPPEANGSDNGLAVHGDRHARDANCPLRARHRTSRRAPCVTLDCDVSACTASCSVASHRAMLCYAVWCAMLGCIVTCCVTPWHVNAMPYCGTVTMFQCIIVCHTTSYYAYAMSCHVMLCDVTRRAHKHALPFPLPERVRRRLALALSEVLALALGGQRPRVDVAAKLGRPESDGRKLASRTAPRQSQMTRALAPRATERSGRLQTSQRWLQRQRPPRQHRQRRRRSCNVT